MADTDSSPNDNQATTVTTGLGENSNAATDSGNADTKPAATAVEPGNNSTALPVDNAKVEHVKPDTASESLVEGTDPEADKTTRPAETERLEGEYVRNQGTEPRFGRFGQSMYGQPHHYGMSPQGTELGYGNFSHQFGGYGGQQQGYGSFGQSMYSRPHQYYGMSPQTSYDQHSASPANVGGFGGASANERGTNNGGHSTNTNGGYSANNNGGYSSNNGGYFPTTYMQPGTQGPQMDQIPPGSSTYHDFRCLILANLV
jgi:hypothetical protein